MLIENKEPKKIGKKIVTFRVNELLLEEFRELAKLNDIKQIVIIENSMRQAVKEMKELEVTNGK